jgi:CubicO group peptidase (beta-lactamase class C family)
MRFRMMLLLAGGVAVGPLNAQQSTQSVQDSLKRVLAGLDAAQKFHGVVLLAEAGRIVHHSAHGLAHFGYKVPNKPDTKFNLASVGKTFTAVAIGQLVQQGKLRFTDTLLTVVPDYPNQEIARRVTIGQLLTHRSGMGLYWEALFTGNWTAVRTINDLVPFFVNDSLRFAPGSQWFYSNTGYAVLALVVERVSGEDYFTYVKRHIFEPLGMSDTDFYPLDVDVPNIAVGYYKDEGGILKNNLFTHTVRGSGAGGGFSTAPDLVKWAEGLRTHKVLNAEVSSQMFSKQTDTQGAGPGGYGYGFMVQPRDGQTVLGHTGGFPGITTLFFFSPSKQRVGVVMSNFPGPEVRQLGGLVNSFLVAR